MIKKYLKIKNATLVTSLLAAVLLSSNLCFANESMIENTEGNSKAYIVESVHIDRTPAMEEYVAQSRKKIKDNWYPPTDAFENSATILIKLDKTGKLIDCSLLKPSESVRFNNSLVKAVKKTKFEPLPDEVSEDTIDIDFTFDMHKRQIQSNKQED